MQTVKKWLVKSPWIFSAHGEVPSSLTNPPALHPVASPAAVRSLPLDPATLGSWSPHQEQNGTRWSIEVILVIVVTKKISAVLAMVPLVFSRRCGALLGRRCARTLAALPFASQASKRATEASGIHGPFTGYNQPRIGEWVESQIGINWVQTAKMGERLQTEATSGVYTVSSFKRWWWKLGLWSMNPQL